MKKNFFFICISLFFAISINAQQDAITVINPETTVMVSDSITYNVQYTKSIQEDAYVLIRFKAANGDNLEFAIQTVSATTGTIPLTVKAPDVVGNNYSIEAQLLKTDWGSLKNYDLNNSITVRAVGGNGGDVNNLDQVVYYAPGENNDFHKQNLGNGYWTNWFIDQSWLGSMEAKFGPAQTPAYIAFENQGGQNGHGEIDIKIQKASWSENSTSTRGYPSKINDVSSNLPCSIEGSWAAGSKGRAFINMTAWIYNVEDIDDASNQSYRKRCDVIVHTWDNSGALHEKYADKEANNPSEGYRVLNSFTSNGVEYHVLKKGGGNGEAATFNLVPKANLRFSTNPNYVVSASQWQADFENSMSSYTVNMEDILNKLIISENNSNKNPVGITNQWYLHVLEWTVVPSGQDTVDGVLIDNAEGRYNINSYTIPNLLGNPLAKVDNGEGAEEIVLGNQSNSTNDVISMYPNPFKDSFTYVYNATDTASVQIDIYDLNGKKIKLNATNNDASNSITFNTSDLNNGIYVLRVSSDKGTVTKRIIKN